MPSPTDSAPCGSKSTSSTRRPCCARAAPRLIVVVVLPTPPFWLQTAATLAGPCVSRGSGSGKTGTGRPVGPSAPGLTSNVRDAATANCTSQAGPADARMRLHAPAENPDSSARLGPGPSGGKPTHRLRRNGPRVRADVDLAEPVHRDQRVDLRGGDRRMPEQLLDDPDVGAAVQEARGGTIAQ